MSTMTCPAHTRQLAIRSSNRAVILAEGVVDAPGNYFVLVGQLQFDGKLNRILRMVVSRGIRNDMENRLGFIRTLIDAERAIN